MDVSLHGQLMQDGDAQSTTCKTAAMVWSLMAQCIACYLPVTVSGQHAGFQIG